MIKEEFEEADQIVPPPLPLLSTPILFSVAQVVGPHSRVICLFLPDSMQHIMYYYLHMNFLLEK